MEHYCLFLMVMIHLVIAESWWEAWRWSARLLVVLMVSASCSVFQAQLGWHPLDYHCGMSSSYVTRVGYDPSDLVEELRVVIKSCRMRVSAQNLSVGVLQLRFAVVTRERWSKSKGN